MNNVSLAGLSAFGPGVIQGENNAALAAQQQTKAQGMAYDFASDIGYAASLAALGQSLSVAPPGGPTPSPPGTASQPVQPVMNPPPGAQAQGAAPGNNMPGGQAPPVAPTSASPSPITTGSGQPAVPPNAQLPPQAQMLQQANGGAQPTSPSVPSSATSVAQPRQQMAPQQRPAVPPTGLGSQQQQPDPQQLKQAVQQKVQQVDAATQSVQQQAAGTMSTQQLAALVMKANPGIQNNPHVFVRVMERMQKFLSADGKNEFAQQKVSLEYDAKVQKINADAENAVRRAQSATEIAQIRATSAQQVADIRLAQAESVAATAAASRQTIVNIQQKGAEERLDKTLSAKTAAAIQANQPLPPEEKKFLGQALLAGDNSTIQLAMGFSKNRAELMNQIIQGAQEIDPSFTGQKAASAVAQFGGMKTAANRVGATAGNVAVGAAEVPQLLPLATEASKKLDLGRFPTVNSLELAEKYYAGKPDQQAAVAQLRQYVQSMRNAYQQIMARGGRQTVFNAKQAEELVNGNMPLSTLLAAGKAMEKEAVVVKSATGQAMQEVTGAPSETPSPTDKGGTTQLYFDAEGNQIPAPK